MIHCQCGYVIESDEFKYCPKCGGEVPEAESGDEYVTPDNLTVPRLKRIIERSEQPIRLRVHRQIDEELEETSLENATALLIHGIDPEDGLYLSLGAQGSFVAVSPNRNNDTVLFQEKWVTVDIFAIINVKRPGFFDDFSWLDAANSLNKSSLFGAFEYDQENEKLVCQYKYPLFGATTEEEVQKMLQVVYSGMFFSLAPIWERVNS